MSSWMGRVFTEGPEWKREKWVSGLVEELTTMFDNKQALERLDKKTLRQALGPQSWRSFAKNVTIKAGDHSQARRDPPT